MNRMFDLNISTADLLSKSLGSMTMVSTGVADYLGHYASLYSNWSDPRGIDIALGFWRIGGKTTREQLRTGNYWDYVDPTLKESMTHYINDVERFDQ